MPGLLQAPPERFGKTRYLIAAIAEFIGSGLFSFTGTAILAKATAGAEPDVVWAALGNGLALAVASKTLGLATICLIGLHCCAPQAFAEWLRGLKGSQRFPSWRHKTSGTRCSTHMSLSRSPHWHTLVIHAGPFNEWLMLSPCSASIKPIQGQTFNFSSPIWPGSPIGQEQTVVSSRSAASVDITLTTTLCLAFYCCANLSGGHITPSVTVCLIKCCAWHITVCQAPRLSLAYEQAALMQVAHMAADKSVCAWIAAAVYCSCYAAHIRRCACLHVFVRARAVIGSLQCQWKHLCID